MMPASEAELAARCNAWFEAFATRMRTSGYIMCMPDANEGFFRAFDRRAPTGAQWKNEKTGAVAKYERGGVIHRRQIVEICRTSQDAREAVDRMWLLVIDKQDTSGTAIGDKMLSMTQSQFDQMVNEAVDRVLQGKLDAATRKVTPEVAQEIAQKVQQQGALAAETQAIVEDSKKGGLQQRRRRKAVEEYHADLAAAYDFWNARIAQMAAIGITLTPPRKGKFNNKLDKTWLRMAQARWDEYLARKPAEPATA